VIVLDVIKRSINNIVTRCVCVCVKFVKIMFQSRILNMFMF